MRRKQTSTHYVAYPRTGRSPVSAHRQKRWFARVVVVVGMLGLTGGVTYASLPAPQPSKPTPHHTVSQSLRPAMTARKSLPPPAAPSPKPVAAASPTPVSAPAPHVAAAPAPIAAPPPAPTACSGNTTAKLILVSIGQQHLWACSGSQLVYESAVTTGAYEVAGDATPTGTWSIYSKQTNVYLTGPGYRDFVQYWMPFYSDYGFHDSSWQTFPFGSAQYATDGSHGCVHLPTPTAAWIYSWAPIGTTVTIQS